MRAPKPTASEMYFEQWCSTNNVECRRIKIARTRGHKRPDYAIRVGQQWCIVEIKQIDPGRDDKEILQEALRGEAKVRWVKPGARLRHPIRSASSQLKKFSERGFPTVVCFFDNSIGFYTEDFHIIQAMAGKETLTFEVSADPKHPPRFLGTRFGKESTLTKDQNTSVSAVAVLRLHSESAMSVDLYHNRFARVPILPGQAKPYVSRQHGIEADPIPQDTANIWVVMNGPKWADWLADPEGMCAREVEQCLREFRQMKSTKS